MAYRLEGDLLEVCNCDVLCPCWIGEDPDRGLCDRRWPTGSTPARSAALDVGGVVMASVVKIPGNVFAGGWRRQLYIDTGASDAQADGAGRGDDRQARRADGRARGAGRRRPAAAARRGRLRPARGQRAVRRRRGRGGGHGALPRPGRRVTTLNDSAFSTIPGDAGLRREGGALPAAPPGHSGSTWRSRGTTPSRAASGSRRDRRRRPAPGLLRRRAGAGGARLGGAGALGGEPLGAAISTTAGSPRPGSLGAICGAGPGAARPLCRGLGADARGDDAADDAAGALALRPDRRRGAATGPAAWRAVALGYLAAWAGFGIVAHSATRR